jgi:hypothetical protein
VLGEDGEWGLQFAYICGSTNSSLR